MAGLSAASALSRSGWEVVVFERSRHPLQGRGAGIVLHPVVFQLLDRDPADISARAALLRYLDRTGAVASEQPCDYRFISYSGLHGLLLEGIDLDCYHLGCEVVDFAERPGRVEVVLADGRRERGDLLVCADGIRSTARQKLLPDVRPAQAGYVAWRGTVIERDLGEQTLSTFADAITYCILPNSHILVYPIPGYDGSLDPGSRLINWVWYRNVGVEALDELLVDRTGVRHDVSVGSGQVPDRTVDQLATDANSILPPQLVELVTKSDEPFVQVVYDIAVPRMAFGSIALIGDAAFALRPHVAAGTAKAVEDGWTLARTLADSPQDLPGALAEWEAAQLRLGTAAVDRARDAGIRSQVDDDWHVGDPLPFGLHEAGDSLLTDGADPGRRH